MVELSIIYDKIRFEEKALYEKTWRLPDIEEVP